jgi:TatA/E family protein of Tat protein translocase
MFGMGMPEILLILAIALIVIGPKKLPDLAKSMGKAFGEFKRATSDFKQAIDVDNDIRTVKKTFDDIDLDNIADAAPKGPPAEEGESKNGADDEQAGAAAEGDEWKRGAPEDPGDPVGEPAAGEDPKEATRAEAPSEENTGADPNAS